MLPLLSRITVSGLTSASSLPGCHQLLLPNRIKRLGKLSYFLKRCVSHSEMDTDQTRRIAVCQMTSTGNREKNLRIVTKLIEDAAAEKALMAFFPEACDFICCTKREMIDYTEPIHTSYIVKWYRQMAKKHQIWLSMGGVHERDKKEHNKVFNTNIIIDSNGDIVQSYRKLHLFDVDIPEKGIRLKESDYVNAGQDIVNPVKTPVGSVGLAICYDMRFPELGIQLAALGADIVTYPSAFTYATGKAHWETLLRCRAIENQCYVIAAAQVGAHNHTRTSFGHAMCVGPWGDVVATCGPKHDEACFVIADLDLKRIAEVRKDMPVQQHRRSDVYKIMAPRIRLGQIPEHITSEEGKIIPETANQSTEEVDTDGETEYFNFSDNKIRASTVFYQTELCYAFVNIRCVVPGHVLVATKRVAERTQDLTPEEVTDFFHMVVRVQKVMERVHKASSSTVTVQDGPDAGQTVEHVHCHIMPRHRGDFKDVDMIYSELAKHDAKPLGSLLSRPARSLQEMREEANLLRSYFT